MAMNPRLLRPTANDSPASIPGLALWLDASAPDALYTTDAGPVTAVSSPLDISGCVGWWDASDLSTMRQNSNGTTDVASADDPVGYWADKSGNGRHARQASPTGRPLVKLADRNGLAGLDFDGSNDYFACDSGANFAAAFALAVVRRTGSPADWSGMFVIRGAGSVLAPNSAQEFYVAQTSSRVGGLGGLTSAGGLARLSGTTVATVNSGFFNVHDAVLLPNTTDTSVIVLQGNITSTVGVQYPHIGLDPFAATRVYPMRLYELIVYDTVPDIATIARVEAYLAAKWGISNVHAPAVTASDPVGYWRDRSGNGRHATQSTAASRPVVGTQNGRRALTFANANSIETQAYPAKATSTYLYVGRHSETADVYFQTGAINQFHSHIVENVSKFRRNETGSSGVVLNSNIGLNQLSLWAPTYSNSLLEVRRNGATIGSTTTAATVADANVATSIGRFPGGSTTYPFAGDICEFLVYSRALSAAERRKVEVYLARRWGITLAPQVSNAEAQDWISRVYANGGTVSQSTASAVSTMCDAIDAAGIRDRFYRLNLFCGDNLNAALVPLYRGPTYSPDGLGAELWSASTPSIINASGSNGSWDGSTLTMTNTGTGTDGSFPRFAFSLPLTTGKRYAVSGTLTGDKSAVAYIRLAPSGSFTDISYNSTTGIFTATAATASAAHIQFLMNATLGTKSVTIASLSVREVLTYGNATDTNNGPFVGGDYVESVGLTKNVAATKYIDTGLAPDDLPSVATGHLAAYRGAGTAANQALLGVRDSGGTHYYEIFKRGDSRHHAAWGGTSIALPATEAAHEDAGFLLVSRTSSTSLTLYRDGVSIATQGATITPAGTDRHWFLFALNTGSPTSLWAIDVPIIGYSIGDGMDATEAAALSSAMQTFQTALGRA